MTETIISSTGALVHTMYAPAPLGTLSALTFEGVELMSEMAPTGGYEERYYIQGELPNGYYLGGAVPVRVWIEGSEFVAEQAELRLHAFGQDQVDAMLKLGEQLVRQLERLNAAGDKISPRLARDREWLRLLITHNA